MKPIKVCEKNRDAIEAALKEINGRAESFAITCLGDVLIFTECAEQQLAALPKSDRAGAWAECVPAGPTANSYRYGAKSTRIFIERRATGWFLNAVKEDKVFPKSARQCVVTITEAQRDEIQRRSVAAFMVAT